MKKAFILSATRTPFGSFGGVFTHVSAIDLGAAAIRGAITRAGISPEQIDEVYMGNVLSANLGQAPARQAAIKAGISDHVRSEEHTSELQSRGHIVCRLLLEK